MWAEPRATWIDQVTRWIDRNRAVPLVPGSTRPQAEREQVVEDHNSQIELRLQQALSDASIRVRFAIESIEAIAGAGQYRSRMSRPGDDPRWLLEPVRRASFEALAWNSYPDLLTAHKGVIYGYLTHRDVEEVLRSPRTAHSPSTDDASMPFWDAVSGYGEVALVLRDHVRRYTTFTMGDSLGASGESRVAPSWLDRPRWWSADFAANRDPAEDLTADLHELPHAGSWIEGDAGEMVWGPEPPCSFLEAQIHRPIDLRTDVDAVVVLEEDHDRATRSLADYVDRLDLRIATMTGEGD